MPQDGSMKELTTSFGNHWLLSLREETALCKESPCPEPVFLRVSGKLWRMFAISFFIFWASIRIYIFFVFSVLVSKSSPKKPRGRNIFKALFCCLRAQNVGQSAFGGEHGPHREEANTIAKVSEGRRMVTAYTQTKSLPGKSRRASVLRTLSLFWQPGFILCPQG